MKSDADSKDKDDLLVDDAIRRLVNWMAEQKTDPTPEQIEARMELIQSQAGWDIGTQQRLNSRMLDALVSGELLSRIREVEGEKGED